MQEKNKYYSDAAGFETVVLKIFLTLFLGLALGLIWISSADAEHIEDIPDADITMAVERQLEHDVNIPAHLISASTEDGVVTLAGVVDHLLAKERSEEIAATVRGVRSVINMISVLPFPQPDDTELKQRVVAALNADPAADAYEIEVQVKDGVVTLSGTVDSYQEGQLAGNLAKGVEGVIELQNNLTYKPLEVRPDAKIKAEIAYRLYWDVWVNEEAFDIEVRNGKVKISGTARSAEEADRVKYLAWVNAVKSVDVSGVEVDWFKGNTMVRDKKPFAATDSEIEQAVADAFFYDPRLDPDTIKVAAENGIVTLSGTVTSILDKNGAERNALNTLGVWRVINMIKVQPVKRVADGRIRENVEQAFKANPYVSADQVNVSVILGRVFLNGTVESHYEKNKAEELTAQQQGVVDVRNNLKVYMALPDTEDWEILQDIKSELWWSPFVDEERVSVSVKDGVAYLSGEVDNIHQRDKAEENAFEGGARSVINYLKVKNHPYYQGTAAPDK